MNEPFRDSEGGYPLNEPKVSLASYTLDAAALLIFAKSTRLKLSPNLLEEISNWGEGKQLEELSYIAATVPSAWEFVNYTFLIENVSRAFTHQIVRTRTFSFAQQAMRVAKMEDYNYIFTPNNLNSKVSMDLLIYTNNVIQKTYNTLLELGVDAEDARGILPTNIATNIIVGTNMRSLSQMLASRLGGRTQAEYKEVATKMLAAVLKVHPWADKFLLKKSHDTFQAVEAFAERTFGDADKGSKMELLKLMDSLKGMIK